MHLSWLGFHESVLAFCLGFLLPGGTEFQGLKVMPVSSKQCALRGPDMVAVTMDGDCVRAVARGGPGQRTKTG